MSATIETFLTRLHDSGILADAAMDEVRAEAPQHDGHAERFVKHLVKQGRLTAYQAKALWADKGRKLSLGNYVIEDELGRGGMGVVLKAHHRRMKRHVAIKVLPPAVVKDADAIARFQREVEAAAQLTHPNIVGAHDADEIDGQHFLVMEFVDGRDLDGIVRKQGVLDVDRAIDCIVQAARGLEFAHSRGVVHRDVKPANLLLDSEGTVKILDMGLARFVSTAEVGTQANLTGTGAVMGTVDYMSPEQALSTKTADARADVYSLGMTLFRLLTNRPAYTGDSLMARLLAHRSEPIPDMAALNPDVPPALQRVFAKMVAKNTGERQQTMTEVIADLEACRNGTAPATPLTASAPSTGDSSSSGLGDFLQSLDTDSSTSHGTRTTGSRTRSRTATEADADSDPDVAAGRTVQRGSKSDTLPPRTRTKSPPVRARKTSKKTAADWFRDPRILGGAGGTAVLLVLLLLWARSGGDGAPPTAAPPETLAAKNGGTTVAPTDPDDTGDETPPSSGGPPVVAPPANTGWTDLFDGTTTSGWQTLGTFTVANGLLVGSTQGYAITEQPYDDFELEFEWRIAAGGNGGVYYRQPVPMTNNKGTEYQLLDNAGHPNGKTPKTTAGSLYGVRAPTEDVTKPLGEFNTGRIVCRGARVEHWLNGTRLLEYDLEDPAFLADFTTFRGSGPPPRTGHVLLQGHTNEIAFRRIRIRELGAATASTGSSPTVVPITELNRGTYNTSPWPSRDGLRLYWEAGPESGVLPGGTVAIVMAERPDANSPFGEPRYVADGRLPTLSDDELELVCVPGGYGTPLHTSRRATRDVPFPDPVPIPELGSLVNPKSPQIAALDRMLVVQSGGPGAVQFVRSMRGDANEKWGTPVPVPGIDEATLGANPTWPFLADGGRRIWFGRGGNRETEIWTASRSGMNVPFETPEPVLVDGQPLVGRAPRDVDATGELFFSRPTADPNGWELAIVKNYRQSGSAVGGPTAAAAGWTDLFDGRSLTGFEVHGAGGWSVENGLLVADSPETGWLGTTAEFGDHELEVEYRLPAMGNSGLHLRADPTKTDRPGIEVQLLDDAGTPNVADVNRTAAIHNVAAPTAPVDSTPSEWHTIRVRIEGRHVVVVHDGDEVLNTTLLPGQIADRGRIGLQLWRTRAEFRRVRARTLK